MGLDEWFAGRFGVVRNARTSIAQLPHISVFTTTNICIRIWMFCHGSFSRQVVSRSLRYEEDLHIFPTILFHWSKTMVPVKSRCKMSPLCMKRARAYLNQENHSIYLSITTRNTSPFFPSTSGSCMVVFHIRVFFFSCLQALVACFYISRLLPPSVCNWLLILIGYVRASHEAQATSFLLTNRMLFLRLPFCGMLMLLSLEILHSQEEVNGRKMLMLNIE